MVRGGGGHRDGGGGDRGAQRWCGEGGGTDGVWRRIEGHRDGAGGDTYFITVMVCCFACTFFFFLICRL